MSASAASIAARVRGPMPRGFSFEASLTMPAASRPISRASSEIGLPGWYGAIERTYEGESSQGSMSISRIPSCCYGIGTENLEERRLGLELGQRLCHRRVLLVALDVNEEHVFPERGAASQPCARGTRLDARHADAMLRERREQRMHRTGLVLRRHDDRSAIFPRRSRVEPAEHEKARGVIRRVLDRACEHRQAIALAGRFTGD